MRGFPYAENRAKKGERTPFFNHINIKGLEIQKLL